MKLNRRAGLLILPVLMLGYFLAFLGVYNTQKNTLIELETLSAELQLAELSNTLSHYAYLAHNYLYSFINSSAFRALLDARDARYRALVVEGGLLDAIDSFVDLDSSHLSLTVYNRSGALEYAYEDGLDPFAEIDPSHWPIVTTMLDKEVDRYSGLHHNGPAKLIEARLVDRNTLKPPVDLQHTELIAIVVCIEAHQLHQGIDSLTRGGRRIDWLLGTEPQHSDENILVSSTKQVAPYGTLRVGIPEQQVVRQLKQLKYLLGSAFLLITVLSYLLLGWLLRRYITQPVQGLEQDLTAMSIDSDQALPVRQSHDEIGSLSRTFAGLYDELRESYRTTRRIAQRDGLTRLYNRHMFNEFLERFLREAGADGRAIALLYIDIDNFKYINDKFGHSVGDELLSSFATRLEQVLRPSDLVCELSENISARLAGDEFAVILYDYQDDDLPRKVAERVLGIGDHDFVSGADYVSSTARVSVSLSVGVACYPRNAGSAEELIRNADAAMYQAKGKGKNQFSFYSHELAEQARRYADIENCLKQLDHTELSLCYMPIVHTVGGGIAGLEALVRWESPVLGSVGPSEFMPIAEATGAYRTIDRWVIARACDDLDRLQKCFGSDIKVAVNISSAELESREFVDDIADMIAQGLLRPGHMELEITETFHLHHSQSSEQILAELRRLGFSICIDDFGTGFTSLVQLVEYAIDKIKLDKSFVDRVVKKDRLEVITSLVNFCHSQNFTITVEGIESAEQMTLLAATGCDFQQGYYFMRPASLEELLAMQFPQTRLCSHSQRR